MNDMKDTQPEEKSGHIEPEIIKPPQKIQPDNNPGDKSQNSSPSQQSHPKDSIVHTFKDDVRDSVKEGKVSMVRALAAELDKKDKNIRDNIANPIGKNTSRNKQRGLSMRFILISSFTLIALGLIAIIAGIQVGKAKDQIAINKSGGSPIDLTPIFTEYRTRINVTDLPPKEILFDIRKMNDKINATLGSMTNVILEKKDWDPDTKSSYKYQITQSEMIDVLGLDFSEQFTRLLGNEADYMIGIHIADRNTPFILITTQSYEHALAEMLNWEKKAERKLSPLMDTEGSISPHRTFSNMVIQNIPARVIRDDDNNIRLLYAFLDEHTILITNNVLTLSEVSRRYKVRKASKLNL